MVAASTALAGEPTFPTPLLPRKATPACLKRVRRALGALGDLNDLQVAETLYRQLAGQEPQAWFAVGFLAGRRAALQAEAASALKRLRSSPPF